MAVWILFDGDRLFGPLTRAEVVQFISKWGSAKKSLFISHVDHVSWLSVELWQTLCLLETEDPKEFVRIAGEEGLLRQNSREVLGPFDYNDLIVVLKKVEFFDRMELKMSKLGLWIPLVLFPHLIRCCGKQARRYPRVLVDGSMHIQQASSSQTGRLIDLSEGGCAAFVDKRLAVQDSSPAQLLIRGLDEPILLALHTLPHKSAEGRLSFRFASMEERYKQAIAELIRRQIFLRFEAMIRKAA